MVNKDVPVVVNKFKNAKKTISIYPEQSINKFISKNDNFEFSTGFEVYELKAPIVQGDVVGKMFVFDKNNMVVEETNLIAGESVSEIGFKEHFQKLVHLW